MQLTGTQIIEREIVTGLTIECVQQQGVVRRINELEASLK